MTFFDEAMRRSEEEFFKAIDKALESLTVREIAQAVGTSIPSVKCWAAHTRAPHPAVHGHTIEIINKLLEAKRVDST